MDGLLCQWYRLNVQGATGSLASLYIIMIDLPVVIFLNLLRMFFASTCSLPGSLWNFGNAELVFEADLSNHDRAVVHDTCKKLGLKSKSRGYVFCFVILLENVAKTSQTRHILKLLSKYSEWKYRCFSLRVSHSQQQGVYVTKQQKTRFCLVSFDLVLVLDNLLNFVVFV